MFGRIKQFVISPGVQGMVASLLVLAGLVLMARSAVAAWQVLRPSVPPVDVRVLDDAGITAEDLAPASLPDDVTVLDDAPVDEPAVPGIAPMAVPVTAAATSLPSPAAAAQLLAETAPAPAASDTPEPQTPVLGDSAAAETAPAFAWEGDAGAVVEVVDVGADHGRNAELGLPTRLVIPSIRVDSPVVGVDLVTSVQRGRTVSTWQVARDAVGFHSSSALPGTRGNTVMSGHNNAWGRVFRDLIDVKRGDEIAVHVGDRVVRYIVEDKVLVRETRATDLQRQRNAEFIAPTDDERLTLVSCWPYRLPTHRVIVVARPQM